MKIIIKDVIKTIKFFEVGAGSIMLTLFALPTDTTTDQAIVTISTVFSCAEQNNTFDLKGLVLEFLDFSFFLPPLGGENLN